jgi:hypothetical protein
MVDQSKETQDTTGTTTEPTQNADDIRTTPAFKGLAREAAEWKRQAEELSAWKAQVEAERQNQEQAALAEQGKYEKAMEMERAKYQTLEQQLSQATRARLEVQAENTLRGMGLNDPLRLKGAVSLLPGDATDATLAQWAAGLKESMPDAFVAAQAISRSNGSALAGNAGVEGSKDWKAVKQDLFDRRNTQKVQQARKAAQATLGEYMQSHGGRVPDGWDQL